MDRPSSQESQGVAGNTACRGIFEAGEEMKPRLCISFSGGRTSAVMTKYLLQECKDTHDISVTFANTGCEHPKTLEFIHNCDTHFGFHTVWLEAVINPERGKGVRHKIVTYETASRDGQPFRDFVGKHGIPNAVNPNCTGRLKEDVMKSFLRSLGWGAGTYDSAIGIRADEADRCSVNAKKHRFIYPLVTLGVTKEDVIRECRTWPFDLELPGEHYGNCTWCWKKSLRKLLTVARHNPEFFDFPLEMDRKYAHFKKTPASTSAQGDRRFFRGHLNTQDILDMAKEGNFKEFTDKFEGNPEFDPILDVGSSCGESCEIGADDDGQSFFQFVEIKKQIQEKLNAKLNKP